MNIGINAIYYDPNITRASKVLLTGSTELIQEKCFERTTTRRVVGSAVFSFFGSERKSNYIFYANGNWCSFSTRYGSGRLGILPSYGIFLPNFGIRLKGLF